MEPVETRLAISTYFLTRTGSGRLLNRQCLCGCATTGYRRPNTRLVLRVTVIPTECGEVNTFVLMNSRGNSVQGTTISQNRLESSTSVIRGVTPKLAASFSKVVLSTVVARKPSLQTITPLPVA
jgi:hypothetical protein